MKMNNECKLKPIETVYKGIKFRSKLEAQWAVFFDLCGADWEYEPQGFDLGDGVWYLPDFLLHNVPSGYVNEDHPVHWFVEEDGTTCFECKTEGRHIIKNLWVEVKGVMDEESAEKIKRFRKGLNYDSQMLIVGKMFSNKNEDIFSVFHNQMENDGYVDRKNESEENDVYFYQPDGYWTGFLETLGADKTGNIGVYGDYKWFSRAGKDCDKTDLAYFEARNYRFDHKNNGVTDEFD